MSNYVTNRMRAATSGCPDPPAMDKKERVSKAAELAKSLGVTACRKDYRGTTAEAQFSGEVDLLLASANVAGGVKTTSMQNSAMGCEQVLAIADSYNKTISNISCTLSRSEYSSTKTLQTGNTITFEAGKDLNVNCPILKIDQNISVKFVSLESLNESEKTQITTAITDVIKKTDEAIQQSSSGVGAVAEGSKVAKDTTVDIQQQDYKEVVNETIKNMELKADAQNNITFKAGGNLTITGNQCELNQNIIIDIVAQNLVSTTLEKVFDGKISNAIDQISKTTQESKQLGQETLDDFGKLSGGGGFNKDRFLGRIVGGFMLLLILGVIGFVLFNTDVGKKAMKDMNRRK